MALFKPFRGTRATLPQELHDGYAYFCTDDGSFHIDFTDADGNLQRKQINAKDAETLTGMTLEEIKAYVTIQPDWNQTDETKIDYIKNKPVPLELDSDPTTNTKGTLGQLCINRITKIAFICTEIVDGVYAWQKVPAKLSDLENDLEVITPDTIMAIMDEVGFASPIADGDNSILATEENEILIL